MLIQPICRWTGCPVYDTTVILAHLLLTSIPILVRTVQEEDLPMDVACRVPILYTLVSSTTVAVGGIKLMQTGLLGLQVDCVSHAEPLGRSVGI